MSSMSQRYLFPVPSLDLPESKCPYHSIVEKYKHRRTDSMHWHNFTQVWFLLNGALHININGQILPLSAGSLVIVPSYDIHYLNSIASDNPEGFAINLTDKLLSCSGGALADLLIAKGSVSFDGTSLPLFTRLSGDAFDAARTLLADTYETQFSSDKNDISVISSKIYELFLLIARNTAISSVVAPKQSLYKYKESVDAVEEHLFTNFKSSITSDSLCKIAAMSRATFFNTFKLVTGSTYSNHLTLIRLTQAQLLSRATDACGKPVSLEYVAANCGFADKSHYIKTLKQYTGLTPHQARIRDIEWIKKFSKLFP